MKLTKLTKLPKAMADLIETADYYAEDDIELADRFFDAFEETLIALSRAPKLGSSRAIPGRQDVRMWFIRGFEKCLIFYTENADEILILRVIHASRNYTTFFDAE